MGAYQDLILAEPGCVSFWPLNETAGTTATDAKGANNGTYTGLYALNAAGPLTTEASASADFTNQTGAGSYVTVPDSVGLRLSTSAWSTEVWLKPASTTPGTFKHIISKTNATNTGYVGQNSDGSSLLRAYYFETVGGIHAASVAGWTWTTAWQHLVTTYDGSNIRIYKNGALVQTTAATPAMSLNTTQALCIGCAADAPGAANAFAGNYANVAVYNTTLSAATIHQHWLQGVAITTPKFICGAECGIAAAGTASAGTEHWSSVTATGLSVVTSGPATMRSPRAFRFNPSAAAPFLIHTFATAIASGGTAVGRFYVYFATLPNVNVALGTFRGGTSGSERGAYFNQADSKIYAGSATSTLGAAGVAVTTGQWYRVDVMSTFAATHTVDVQVNGSAASQLSAAVAAETCISFTTGAQTFTGDYYIDDITVTATATDYPIGDSTIVGLYPNGDKTNSAASPTDGNSGHLFSATTAFGKGASGAVATGAQNAESTSWQSLQNPLSTTIPTNWIADLLGASAEHLVWTLDDLPAAAMNVNGVMLVATSHSASATANNQSMFWMNTTYAARSTAWGLLDLSELTITVPVFVLATATGGLAWTPTLVNGVTLGWGDSTDVSPDPYLDGVCLEVDYVPSPPVVSRPPSRRDVRQAIQRAAFY